MDVDESFTAYAAVRWSRLFRLATLLAGSAEADRLTRAALVRAYLSWPDLREPASADATVTQILAATAAKDTTPSPETGPTGDEAGDPAGPGGGRLWEQIRMLPPHLRAVLVLRHYELLSDVEIARVLRSSSATVAGELRAIETGVDLGELREELSRVSEEAVVPAPPLDALLAAGHAERRRRHTRSWRRGIAGAAVLALALLVANLVDGAGGHTSTQPPAESARPSRFLTLLPDGKPPRIAYAVGRSLHLPGGTVVRLGDVPTGILQTKKWLYAAYLSGAIVRIDPATGDKRIAATSSQGELASDPAGEHLAWLAAGEGSATVVLRTVWDGAVALSDEQEFPARPRCCDNPFLIDGITTDGQVVVSLPGMERAWVWATPDGGAANQVRAIEGLGHGTVSQVVAAGVVVEHESLRYEVGSVADGRFVRAVALTARQADFSDPLGHRVVYVDGDGGIHVREIVSRRRSDRGSGDVRMVLPLLAQGYGTVRWEDVDHVLLDVSDPSLPQGALVRCGVDDGSCEIAVRFDRSHLVAQ